MDDAGDDPRRPQGCVATERAVEHGDDDTADGRADRDRPPGQESVDAVDPAEEPIGDDRLAEADRDHVPRGAEHRGQGESDQHHLPGPGESDREGDDREASDRHRQHGAPTEPLRQVGHEPSADDRAEGATGSDHGEQERAGPEHLLSEDHQRRSGERIGAVHGAEHQRHRPEHPVGSEPGDPLAQLLAPGAPLHSGLVDRLEGAADGGDEGAMDFMSKLNLFYEATSLGGVESLIEVPATSSHMAMPVDVRIAAGIEPGYVRISVGIEDVEDLWEDLNQALD